MTEKYVKGGSVGVLYSPGFGAGWSTWGDAELAYDADLVRAFVEGGKEALRSATEEKYPDSYMGGLDDIVIAWVPQGTLWRVSEYDGNESIEYSHSAGFQVA